MLKKWKINACFILFMALSMTYCCPIGLTEPSKNYDNPAYTQRELNDQSIMAILWMQTSAEYRALCYQAYNVADLELERALAIRKSNDKKPMAIIVDCDDTVLQDGSAQAYYIGTDKKYNSHDWEAWVAQAKAEAVPGAVEFLNKAVNNGVTVFYIPNRNKATELEGTLKNLKKEGFPMVDKEHVLLKTDSSNKQKRFDQVAQRYNVIMFIGDNVEDMPIGAKGKITARRNGIVDENKGLFGTKYIVLPNPMYGGWESSFVKNYYSLSAEQKDSVRRARLER